MVQWEFVQEVSARAPQWASYRLPPHTIYQPPLLRVTHLPHTTFDVLENLKHNLWSLLERTLWRPQLTVIYKIVLILPAFYGSLLTSVIVTSHKCTLVDVVELKHELRHKNVKRLGTQLCWGWTLRGRMATKGPLLRPRSMSLCCFQKPWGNKQRLWWRE